MARVYAQGKRASTTAETRRKILDAAQSLFRAEHQIDPALDLVAERAGCSTRSVIRHFGSKEGLMEAAIADATATAVDSRRVPPGEVEAGLGKLVDHYEADGDEVIRWLASAERYPLVRRITETGTRIHREWVEVVFAPDLEGLDPAARRARAAALVTATDVYVWWLLRRRESLSRAAAEAVIKGLVEAARRTVLELVPA